MFVEEKRKKEKTKKGSVVGLSLFRIKPFSTLKSDNNGINMSESAECDLRVYDNWCVIRVLWLCTKSIEFEKRYWFCRNLDAYQKCVHVSLRYRRDINDCLSRLSIEDNTGACMEWPSKDFPLRFLVDLGVPSIAYRRVCVFCVVKKLKKFQHELSNTSYFTLVH